MDSSTFNVAVRHFFRHLHDVRRLRHNPIAERLFEDPTIGGFGERRDRAVLARIHTLVGEAAADLRRADDERGKSERAFRQYTLVREHYLDKRSLKAVAAELHVSIGACYRDRRDICQRIATYIMQTSSGRAVQQRSDLDLFRVRAERVDRVAAYGDAALVYRECEALQQAAESFGQEIEAFCTLAKIALRFGDLERAARAILMARRSLEIRGESLTPATGVALSTIELCEAGVADRRRDHSETTRLAATATQRLRELRSNGHPYVDGLYRESLTALAAARWNSGDIERAYEALVEAEALANEDPPSNAARLSVGIALWRVRNRLLLSSRTWYPVWRRVEELQRIFDVAFQAGRLLNAIEALQGVSEIHGFARNDVEAMRSAQLVIALASQHGSAWVQNSTALAIGEELLRTSYYSYGLKLISDVVRRSSDDPALEPRLSNVRAEGAIALGDFERAWTLTCAREPSDPTEFGLGRRITRATVANQLGYDKEARTEVERLVPLAEAYGSAPVLADAYKIAATVTAKAQYKKKATEIANLLAS